MIRVTVEYCIGLFALIALSACAGNSTLDRRAGAVEECRPPNTLTCDRFKGENYNCSCERGDRLKDILDAY